MKRNNDVVNSHRIVKLETEYRNKATQHCRKGVPCAVI